MMTTKTLIVRKIIDGEELVCLAPWFYEQLIALLPDDEEIKEI